MQLWVLRFKQRYFRFWKMRRERDTRQATTLLCEGTYPQHSNLSAAR
jgi:hypothetical protein